MYSMLFFVFFNIAVAIHQMVDISGRMTVMKEGSEQEKRGI